MHCISLVKVMVDIYTTITIIKMSKHLKDVQNVSKKGEVAFAPPKTHLIETLQYKVS